MAKSDEFGLWAGLLGAFLASGVYLVLAAVRSEKPIENTLQAAAAIGTFAAIAVTLHLTGRQERLRKQQELQRAALIASGIAPRLESLNQALYEITNGLRGELRAEPPNTDERNIFFINHHQIYRLIFTNVVRIKALSILNVGADELVDLTPLPKECANRLYLQLCRINDYIASASLAQAAPEASSANQALQFGRSGHEMLEGLEYCLKELVSVYGAIREWLYAQEVENTDSQMPR